MRDYVCQVCFCDGKQYGIRLLADRSSFQVRYQFLKK